MNTTRHAFELVALLLLTAITAPTALYLLIVANLNR